MALMSDNGGGEIPGGPTAFMQQRVPLRLGAPSPVGPVAMPVEAAPPVLQSMAGLAIPRPGQAPAAAPVPLAPRLGQAPAAAAPTPGPPVQKCPGPMEMPDGRIIEPDDYITLNDFCELMPYLYDAITAAQKYATTGRMPSPGSQVPVAGGVPQAPGTVPGFGPAQGPFGGGGGAFVSGGGGAPGPQGLQGPPGPPGGEGYVDFVVKTNGSFSAGPGAFVSVPGTLVNFDQEATGAAVVLVQAVLGDGSGTPENGQLGIRLDGIDQPATARLIQTTAAGVAEFLVGQTLAFPFNVAAGLHTVQLVLRGLAVGEFGGGTGAACSVSATTSIPLAVIVIHR
jgi:hypothetical protein